MPPDGTPSTSADTPSIGDITSTSSPTGTLDIAALMPQIVKQFADSKSQITQTVSDLMQTKSAGDAAIGQDIAGIQSASEAEQAKNTLDGAAKARLQADNARAAATLGGDYRISNAAINLLSAKMMGDTDTLTDLADKIQEKQKANFLTDPVQAITNMFTLPSDVARYNTIATNRAQEEAAARGIMEKTSDAMVKNATLDQADAAKDAALLNLQVAGKAMQDVGKANLQMSIFDKDIATTKLAATNQQFTQVIQLNQAALAQATYNLDVSRSDYFKVMTDKGRMEIELGGQEKQLRIKQMQELAANEDYLKQKLELVKPFGINVTPLDFKMKSQQQKDQILELADSVSQFGTGAPMPYTGLSINKLTNLGIGLPPTLSVMQRTLQPTLNGIKDDIQKAHPEIKMTDNDLTWQASLKLEDQLNAQRRNIPDSGSVFSPPATATVLKGSPFLQSSPLAKELEPLAKAAPNAAINPDIIAQTALGMIIKGADPRVIADNYAKYFQQAMNLNNTANNYSKIAINPMMEYNRTLDFGMGVGNTSQPLNLADPVQMQNAFTRAYLSYKQGQDVLRRGATHQ